MKNKKNQPQSSIGRWLQQQDDLEKKEPVMAKKSPKANKDRSDRKKALK
jgi:hypothetical protein